MPRECLSKIAELIGDDESVLLLDPESLDAAIMGISIYQPGRPMRCVVYDIDAVRAILIDDGMSEDDVDEWISFNTAGAWMGDGTPILMSRW